LGCLFIRERSFKVEAYCFKCRAKREIRNPQKVTLKNGKSAMQGVCPVCGTKVFRISKG
jgi:Zn finger protein HypA/HybF involved in hydrogenase expression